MAKRCLKHTMGHGFRSFSHGISLPWPGRMRCPIEVEGCGLGIDHPMDDLGTRPGKLTVCELENDRRNSGFTHKKMVDLSIVTLVYQRVNYKNSL